jgi:hypothetical protein
MIPLRKIRDLDLRAASGSGRPLHLSAASGLVCLNSFAYVIADDELHLGVFRTGAIEPGHLIRLIEGTLPGPPSARKRQKPDLEALTLLPPLPDYIHGALLALGSGSRPDRRSGVIIGLDANGVPQGSPQLRDLSVIFDSLGEWLPAVNIEGAVVSDSELCLLQRANKKYPQNAVIRFQLSDFLGAISSERPEPIRPSSFATFELGDIDGIPLGFTDGAALPNGSLLFTAVAEDTEDAYNDGRCTGAAVGIADGDELRCLYRLAEPLKVEGVHATAEGNAVRLLLVTDADDPAVPASLFAAVL